MISLLYSFMQFLVSEWIWAFTFAWHHPLINLLIMIIFFLLVAKLRMIPAVLYAVGSQLFALLSFTLLVHLVLGKLLGVSFDWQEPLVMIHPLAACFLLGMIYASLQVLYFYLMSFIYRLPFERMSVIVAVSNTISALIVYKFLPPL